MSAPPTGGAQRDSRDLAERLYEEARELPAAERATFITESCQGDDLLREDLCGLIAHADAAEDFFERLAGAVPTAGLLPIVITDRYEIQTCIGAGGMGAVYKARDRRLQRDVALKFLPPHFAAGPDAQEHLLREARAAAGLEHPNVCTVHEISRTEDGRPFISMVCYEGETLKERLRHGAIPVAEAVEIGKQIARGLAAAHVRKIVHRDVKPGNVMLLSDATVKLLDFGIARLADAAVTGPGGTRGTVAYMSPEQARGDAVDARCDLFALGVVLHEMVTGVQPFRGGNDRAVLQAILHDPPVPLRRLEPQAPPALEQIVDRLLRKEPDARYADASELLADLEELTPKATTVSPRFASARKPRAWLAAAIGLVVVAVLTARTLSSRHSPYGAARTPAVAVTPPPSDALALFAKTIAVLPFANLSGDPAEEYLVDGLTEELIGALSHVSGLRVVARTSAFAFKDTHRDIRDIGEALGVSAILEGSIQRVGDHIRVRAQLVNVADGMNLWADAYDREVTDVFAMQQELALRISGSLQVGLSPSGQERVRQPPTVSPEAYGFYLKGRHFWNQRTSSAFVRAREYYQRAIEADSLFASAWAGLAAVYSLQGLWGDLPSAVARERVRAAATRAVELDDQLSEAHSALGVYMHVYEWDGQAAEREQLRAIELNPRVVTVRYFYGNLLRSQGRFDEAIAQYRVARELDPLDPLVGDALGRTLVLAGRLDEAREYLQEALDLDSMFWWPHAGLGAFYEAKGELAESLREYRRAAELGGSIPHVARLLARTGQEQEARMILDRLQAEAARTGIHPPEVATILYALHDADGAMAWLEQSYRERHPKLRFIAGLPEYALLEAEPRYVDLLRRIGLRR